MRRPAGPPARRAALAGLLTLSAALEACAAPATVAPPPAPGASAVSAPPAPAAAGQVGCDAACVERLTWDTLRALPGGRGLQLDPLLAQAARAAADLGAEGTDLRPADALRALERLGAGHPSPQGIAVRGPPARAAERAAALAVEAAARGEATHAGVGAATDTRAATLFVLVARERAELAPVPPRMQPGSEARVAGKLREGLVAPRLWAETPAGTVEAHPLNAGPMGFEGTVPLTRPGRWRIQVLAKGPRGPEVVGQWRVDVGEGAAEPREPDPPEIEPPDADAASAIVARINALRVSRGLGALARDPVLDQVARAHSEAMLRARQFGHTLPETGDLAARLRAARYPFARAAENVAQAQGPLAAHRATVESPAHLANLLDPDMTHAGVGVVRGEAGLLVTEVLAEKIDAGSDPAARALAVVNAARGAQGLPPLVRDSTLDAFARDHLAQAIAAERLGAERDEGGTLQDMVLTRTRALAVAVDFFVGARAEEARGSKNLIDPTYNRVGIAAQAATTPKYGAGRLWMLLLYARFPK